MRKSSILVLFLFFIYKNGAEGQNITGQVRDSLGVPISFASLVATSCKDEQVSAFTNTDDQGRFQLTIKTDCDSITVTARSLGYHTVAKRLALGDLPAEEDFALISTVLQEVLVRDKTPPVIARNDTTEYNVASFSDNTEVRVEDMLKKLPGVRVAENGLITYNGKTIERVMIDGDDLFSQNYTLATRNIRADLISKVQVIDRFQENPLMKGIQESDRMVMNLKIKPERRRALSGSVELGSGYGGEWKSQVSTNLFSLSRKEKLYLIGNANNSGENALSDIEWTAGGGFQGFGKQQTLQANPMKTHDLLYNISLENAGLPPIYTQINKNRLVYLGLVLPSSPAFKTKVSGWVGGIRLRQESGNATQYLIGSDLIATSEETKVKKQSQTFNLQTESDYFSLDKKHALRSFFKIGKKPISYHSDLLRNQTGGDEFRVISQSNQQNFDIFGSFEYTLKQRESTAFQIVSKIAWHKSRSILRPEYVWYASFFGLDSSFTHLQQYAIQQQGESILLGRWLARCNAVQWQSEAGLDWNWAALGSSLKIENNLGEQRVPGSAYQNDIQVQHPRYFANISATRTFASLLVRARTGLSYGTIRFKSNKLLPLTPRLWAAEPRIDLRYTLKDYTTISGYYGFEQKIPPLSNLNPGFVFSDYQIIVRGIPDIAFLYGHQAGLQYRYNHQIRQLSWNVGANMAKNKNQFGTQYQINPFLIIQERFRPIDRALYSINGGADRYARKLRSRFEFGYGLNFLREKAKINNETLTNLSQNIYAANLGYGTAFDTWVNVVLSSQISQTVGRNALSALASRSVNWFSTAQINVKPNNVFDLKIFVHQVANRVGANPYNIAYASNCVAYFRLKKWRSTIECSAVNLLGSRKYEEIVADAFSQSITNVTAVQRFFLLSWEISF